MRLAGRVGGVADQKNIPVRYERNDVRSASCATPGGAQEMRSEKGPTQPGPAPHTVWGVGGAGGARPVNATLRGEKKAGACADF